MQRTEQPQQIPRPDADEHSPYYAKYIEQVPEGDLVSLLREQVMETTTLLAGLSPEQADYAYAPGKWTVKEVVGHIIDVERVMTYRALRISRGDATPLPSFDENLYVEHANFGDRTLDDLVEELQVVRAATVQLAKHMSPTMLARRGTASGNPVTVRALMYIVAGHERHHTRLLRDLYLAH